LWLYRQLRCIEAWIGEPGEPGQENENEEDVMVEEGKECQGR
jgi:hypothetical protein